MALFSVAVPYSSVPHTKSTFQSRRRPYLRGEDTWHQCRKMLEKLKEKLGEEVACRQERKHGCAHSTETYVLLIKVLPAEDISAEDAADDVAQVRDVVDVRQGAGHKQVPLPLLWQTEINTDGL